MVDRRDIGSWLEGPGAHGRDPADFPGRQLGLPREGPGSLGRFGRRLLGVLIDWTLCQLIAYGLFGVTLGQAGAQSFAPLGIFAAENLLLVATLGQTVGHRLVGLRVVSRAGGAATPLQALIRTALLCLFLPAMFWDRDGRGLHDRAAGTLIVRRGR